MIRRLDHIIVAVRDRRQWVPLVGRVLSLAPGRMLEGAGQGSSGFSNAEFAIGDGFLGVVEPAGETSQLHRFLDRFGDGFYGMSIDVGDVDATTSSWDAQGVAYQGKAGRGLVWLGPRHTHGVLYQVIDGMLLGPGANPHYLGLSTLTIAVADAGQAAADYAALFDQPVGRSFLDEWHGGRGFLLECGNSSLEQRVALLEPTHADGDIGRHLATRGEGIFGCGIAVDHLGAELARLAALGLEVVEDAGRGPTRRRRAQLGPAALHGLRLHLEDYAGTGRPA